MKLFNDIHRFLGRNKQLFRKGVSKWMFEHSREKKKNTDNIKALKNKYLGQRCFIVCTGPSLKIEDLEKIRNHGDITFSCNKIDKLFDRTEWRPDYYCISDEGYMFNMLSSMNKVPSKMQFYPTESFLTTRFCKNKAAWVNAIRDYREGDMFSYDIENRLNTFGTVTYSLLQLAVYMGFKNIYIIGCDNSYAKTRMKDGTVIDRGGSNYFEGCNTKKTDNVVVDTWIMDMAYSLARKEADSHDFTIYNATRGGYLEAFPRVDFDGLFEK